MHADIKGALEQIDRSWRTFEHNGKSMTKVEVRAVLEYGLNKGYKSTDELNDSEVDAIIESMKERKEAISTLYKKIKADREHENSK